MISNTRAIQYMLCLIIHTILSLTHTTYYSNVKAIQKLNETELKLGLDSKSSWHDQYKDSAYIFVGEK